MTAHSREVLGFGRKTPGTSRAFSPRSWSLLFILTATLLGTAALHAQTLAYSFESPTVNPNGFGPNGGGVAVTQDTIGATEGLHSMKVSVVTGATFVGALSGSLNPAFTDPLGVNHITFDLTIAPGEEYTGTFALVGVTIFGASQPDYPGGQQFGLQTQFADFELINGKTAGTYLVQIDLTSATNPLTFQTGQSFNDIFGSGPNQVIPTGFQFFFNKSNDAPMTAYLDNVQVYSVPEPASGTLLALGAASLVLLRRRRTRQ